MELRIPAATVYIFTDLFNDADQSVGYVCGQWFTLGP